MKMTIQSCINFAKHNPTCYLATVEGDQPHVRALGLWFADESGFYFQTGMIKDFCKQLMQNPKTEVCFYNDGNLKSTMLRIIGKVEFIDDIKLKEKVIEDRPFLKTFGLTPDSPRLVIFRISHGQALFWTMESNIKPKEIIEF